MSCKTHANHEHEHGEGCGHTAIKHNDHIDYLHDGIYTTNTAITMTNTF
ncbi:hypothetical protein ABCW44_04550 [Mannheimia haemolytica]